MTLVPLTIKNSFPLNWNSGLWHDYSKKGGREAALRIAIRNCKACCYAEKQMKWKLFHLERQHLPLVKIKALAAHSRMLFQKGFPMWTCVPLRAATRRRELQEVPVSGLVKICQLALRRERSFEFNAVQKGAEVSEEKSLFLLDFF